MPFNFPIAQNNFGQLFAQGIANAIGQYQQQRGLARQRTLDEQQKALAEFQNPGFHFGEPPKTPPMNLIDTETPSPTAVSNIGGTGLNYAAAPAVPRSVTSHPSRVDFSGGYYDPDEAMQIMAPRMQLAGREAFLKALNEAQGKLAGDPGATVARDATARYRGAQAEKINYDLTHPKPPTPHFVQDEKGNYVAIDPATLKSTPVGVQGRIPPPPSQFTFLPGIDPEGKPITVRGNTKTGEVTRTDVGRPEAGQGGPREQAQIAVAQKQAEDADRVMTAFEEKILSGQRTIPASGAAAAKIALGGGALLSTTSETALNRLDPELAAYVRAAKQMATAERLISPRGGSNYLTQAEAMLSAAGPHANADLIRQAREYRRAVVGGMQSHGKQAPASQGGGAFDDLIPKKP